MIALPEEFITQAEEQLGKELWAEVFHGITRQPPTVSVRLNRRKGGCTDCLPASPAGKVPWCADGYYLSERPAFTFDPLLHAGVYYVQEASSMFLDCVLRQHISQPVRMLDLCAAPGGKSTVARQMLPEGSLLVCNDAVRQRAQVLSENMQKWGHPDVVVCNNQAHDLQQAGIEFDVVLADVPCSGEGMFRKDEGAIGEWSLQNVEHCRRLQRDIVTDVWPCLRTGGLFIYSTCTLNVHENEENVKWICENLGAELLPVKTEEAWGITGSLLEGFHGHVYRFLPGRTQGEGLFMAVMRKETSSPTPLAKRRTEKHQSQRSKPHAETEQMLHNADDFCFLQEGDMLRAIPRWWLDSYQALCRQTRVLHAGVAIGRVKGRDLVPDTSLALSCMLNEKAFATAELTYEQAIAYLRKEAITLPNSVPRGFILITYRNHPLGFVKNIGQRANNLYPAEWKIRRQL